MAFILLAAALIVHLLAFPSSHLIALILAIVALALALLPFAATAAGRNVGP